MSGSLRKPAALFVLGMIAAFAFLTAVPGCDAPGVDDAIDQYTPLSEFIFVGTVVMPNDATMVLPGVTNLARVNVEETYHEPATYPLTAHQELTVLVSNVSALASGDVLLFFANSWIFGETLALREIHGEPLSGGLDDAEGLDALVQAAVARHETQLLQARLASASHVVVGRVISTFKDMTPQRIMSEHHPNWSRAELVVADTLKGTLPDSAGRASMDGVLPDTAVIAFVNNPRWATSIRLDSMDTGVFILRDSFQTIYPIPDPALIDERDFLLLSDSVPIDSLVPASQLLIGRVDSLIVAGPP